MKAVRPEPCPCDPEAAYDACCGRFIEGGQAAPTARALMRSRYSAFVRERADYLLATWHPSTRPPEIAFEKPAPRWLGLEVRHAETSDAAHASVEFVARLRIGGRAQRLHENSRFVREAGRWYYVAGDPPA
jgi:SEC-C motif-containing protein